MPNQQPTTGIYYFKLDLGGAEKAQYFMECAGLSTENAVVEGPSIDQQGKPQKQMLPGQISWQNITLKRGVDKANNLWQWRQDVIDGKITDARKDCTIEVLDSQGGTVTTYNVLQAWPCRYSAPALSAGGNEILVEEVEITHEGFTRA